MTDQTNSDDPTPQTGSLVPSEESPLRFDAEGALSVRDWSCEISRLYRAARRGRVESARAAKLVYIAGQGLRAASVLEDLDVLRDLHQQLIENRRQRSAAPEMGIHSVAEVTA